MVRDTKKEVPISFSLTEDSRRKFHDEKPPRADIVFAESSSGSGFSPPFLTVTSFSGVVAPFCFVDSFSCCCFFCVDCFPSFWNFVGVDAFRCYSCCQVLLPNFASSFSLMLRSNRETVWQRVFVWRDGANPVRDLRPRQEKGPKINIHKRVLTSTLVGRTSFSHLAL